MTPIFRLLIALLVTGCASSNYAGLANVHHTLLEPALAVAPITDDVPDMRVTEVHDSNGALIGTEQTVIGYHKVVSGFALERGDTVIDEQDFYELARDRDGLDAVERARARGMRMNRTGLALIVASTVAAIAVPIAAGRGAAPYAVGQWFVAFPIGLGLTLFGQRPFDSKVLPVKRAFAAINQSPASWAARLDRDD